MARIEIKWADDHLKQYGRKVRELNKRFPKVLPRVINQVGNRAKTQVIRNLTKQTGLQRRVVVEAVNVSLAGRKRLSYEMVTRGGNIRLKYLRPRETEEGVIARPFGKPTLYPKAFMMGGAFPNRVPVARFDGHVMFRNRSSGRHYTFARSGVRIPVEMTTGATRGAFERTAAPLLKERVEAVLAKLIG